MTWLEFKNAMESLGVKDDDQIGYIDIGAGSSIDNDDVQFVVLDDERIVQVAS